MPKGIYKRIVSKMNLKGLEIGRGHNKKDIIGKKFNKLTTIRFVERCGNHSFYVFKCECGNEKVIERSKVTMGHTKSCGCWRREIFRTHGLSKTRFYFIYKNMKARCEKPTNKHFKNYGGRGITICNQWGNFSNFKDDMYESYLAHVKQFGEKQTMIERINNNKGYSPKNCTWATWSEQVKNKRPQQHR